MNPPEELFKLSEKVAVVTGASSGLGVAIAKGLAAAGASVVLAARRQDRLLDQVAELEADDCMAMAVGCDVSNPNDVDSLVSRTMAQFGRLDILVNNAGITNSDPAESEDPEIFRKVLDINVTGSFLCARRCGKVMLEAGRGSIINVASIMGFVGIGVIPQAAYNASKGAVVNMTRELAAQWARRGVRVNAIAPGWFPSEMTQGMFEDEAAHNFIRKRTPMGRAGNPDELVGPTLLLASDASSYMTGQIVTVDGGWTII